MSSFSFGLLLMESFDDLSDIFLGKRLDLMLKG